MRLWNLIPENNYISFQMTEEFDGVPGWNAELEILYVLEGEGLSCTVQGEAHTLGRDDFIVLNPYEIHTLQGTGCRAVSLFIFPALLALRTQREGEAIRCRSNDPAAPRDACGEIRRFMADALLLCCREGQADKYEVYENILRILAILDGNFCVREGRTGRRAQRTVAHLQRVVQYIDQNYMEGLTLASVAKEAFISPNYLSHLFRTYLQTSFAQYLRMVRLNHAYADLMNTKDSVTEIAGRNGFSGATAFIQHFSAVYGKTPAKFRKGGQAQRYYQTLPDEGYGEAFGTLLRHATGSAGRTALLRRSIETREAAADCSQAGSRRPAGWNQVMNVGWAKEALLAPLQQQVARAAEELGFRMVRFHGIFDYDMYVYQEAGGAPRYNFTYLDTLFDFLLAHGLSPFVELGFIPPALASDGKAYYNHFSRICFPRDLRRWTALVGATLRHCINRYGLRAVCTWKFTLFNAIYVYYGCISEDAWWTLWQATYEAVKGVHPGLAFGLNDDIGLLSPGYRRFWTYLERGRAAGCKPDFLSFQCFYGDYGEPGGEAFQKVYAQDTMPLPHSPDEDYLAHKLDFLEAGFRQRGLEPPPVLFEAWNSTVWQRDACNDSCFKAAFLVKNILENEQRIQSFGHWTLSDFMEEVPHAPQVFHGGYGILTFNGIPKAGYYALELLRRLGGRLLCRGDGWYITRDGDDIQVMLYHYYHYDLLYQQHYTTKSDSVFRFENEVSFHVRLGHMRPGNYSITEQCVNQEGGSSYDMWLYMGAPDELTREQAEYMKQVAKPSVSTGIRSVGGTYEFTAELRAHEVRLITLHRLHEG
ncbi:GH39 family glycosyl hydrolase [Intestinibacillus massiliensis]|uniref:GH39 family glycosyl hydrolase n=1 Tax=Intestinibacillus massiliensis TaxID=1871029 RepID=UPI000B3602AC|nr:helix-turn-helix domain-containing protein [Intestinibacillus massiliensis]